LDPEVAENESFESLLRNDGETGTYNFESDVPIENVEFRVNDADGDAVVKIRAFDEDGNATEVVVSEVGSDLTASESSGFDVVSSNDNDYTDDDNPIHSFLVTIPGPVSKWEVVHEIDGNNDTGINITDITFDAPAAPTDTGDDVVSGGDGNDILDGGFGNDTVNGDADNDTIIASAGTDDVDGGTGRDTYDAQEAGAGSFPSGINGPATTGGGSTLGAETIEVTVDDNGDGTVEKINDGTTDTVTSVENFVAGEAPAEADVITLTDPIAASDVGTEITGLDNNAVGTFTPDGGGAAIAFGPGGPTLGSILGGSDPAGTYQITDGDEDGQVGNISFSNFETINFTVSGNLPDGIVDGEESGELMGPGYDDSNAPTDQGGDLIDGADGIDDTIEGNGGNDTIDSGLGNDSVDGGSGDDVFDINEEGNGIDNDTIKGGETGETNGDTIDTSDINDDLTVDFTGVEQGTITDGTDTTTFSEIENIQLGGGDDTVNGSDGPENVDGGGGNDDLNGGDGADTLSGGDGDDSISGGLGGDSLSGGDDNDTIEGDEGIDTIDGGDGNDSIDGGSGVDSLDGGDGNDTIDGGTGSDTIDGGEGDDEISGDSGADVILSSDGTDDIDGGASRDTYRDDSGETIEVTVDDDGNGTVEKVGDGTTDTITSVENFVADEDPAEADVITLTTPIPVDDIATEIQGLDNNAVGTFDPADGGPVVSFGGVGEPTLSDVLNGAQPAGDYQITDGDEDGQIGDISFSDFETINFTVTGNLPDGIVDGEESGELMGPGYDDSNAPTDQGGDIIDGPDGIDDTIEGNGGNDTIDSGLGNDSVDGGAGDDVFDINEEGNGIDNDTIKGGETEETVGDTIDTTDINDDLDVDFSAPETGTITDGTDTTDFSEIENIRLGGGDDTVTGSDGNENVDGGGGNDTMSGGGGNDTLSGGDGEDTIDGGAGDDALDGGDDNDTITGGAGSDTVTDTDGDNLIDTSDPDLLTALPDRGFDGYGIVPPIPADADPDNDRDSVTTGDGNDTITTGDDADTISSGGGADVIDSGIDDDSVDAGAGNDSITTGEGSDTVDGGSGNDTIFGGLGPSVPDGANIEDDGSNASGNGPDPDPDNGRDLLDGGLGNDLIFGEDDDDTLIGGGGNDTVDGGIDDDDLSGGVGRDSLIGGQGNDTLDGERGRDTMTGGDGNDVFVETANQGRDFVTDFGAGNTGSINDGDQTNNDFVDLSEFYNDTTLDAVNNSDADPSNDFSTALGMLRADAEDGRIDGVIDGTDYSAQIGGVDITLQNGGAAVTGSGLTFDNTNVACFVRGTQIATRRGSVPIEELKAGDEVITMDHGFQKIRWIGATSVPAAGDLAPVVIRKGAMGNERDLRVSPQHRMLVRGWHVELMFGQKEALVPAKALINDETVFPLEGGTVDYFHMMFDRHELVYAEGIPSESFHPGHVGLGSFAEDTREEILTLFPQLREDAGSYSEHVRPSLKVREAKVLAENPELMKE
jgi:Ca2+-binding RTX toxin-like protein